MKIRELLEDDVSEMDLYVKAIARMFANLGMPGILKLNHRVLKTKLVFNNIDAPIRYRNIKEDVTAAASNPAMRFLYARYVVRGPWPAGETVISTSAWYSFLYALDVIHGRFPAGEDVIVSDGDSQLMYDYAFKAVGGRWPPGEPMIATDATCSLRYARDILADRFPAGETAIAGDTTASSEYARLIIKGRWPPGEAAIAKDPWISYHYADEVLKARFPAGEAAILADKSNVRMSYARNVIKGPWPEAGIK